MYHSATKIVLHHLIRLRRLAPSDIGGLRLAVMEHRTRARLSAMRHVGFFPYSLSLLLGLSCAGSPGQTESTTTIESEHEVEAQDHESDPESTKAPEVESRTDGAGSTDSSPTAPAPPEPTLPAVTPSPVRVALYRAPGVSLESHYATLEALREARGIVPRGVTPEEVQAGALEGHHVVIFTGGRGSVQGRSLGDDGRQIVRDFVNSGGGYIGVCAGSYLAMQGDEEFFKLAIVAARNFSGDNWRRGEHTVEIREVGGEGVHRLFYANGPVFARVDHESIAPYVELASFLSNAYLPAHGTHSGEMPGTPAILAAAYGQGRIILYSPNPVLAADGESANPDLMIQSVRWVATPGPVPTSLQFADVFR